MKRAAVLLVILMISAIPFSIFEESSSFEEANPKSQSAGSGCGNQTHSGGPFYADTANGNDSWAGTDSCPTATIQKAIDLASEGGSIVVRSGTYHETVTLDEANMTLSAADGERVVLDGSESVTEDLGGTWVIHDNSSSEGTIWKANLSKDAWQLFVEYEEEMPARWPNANFSDGTALNDEEYCCLLYTSPSPRD